MLVIKIDKRDIGEEFSLKIFGRNILEHIKSKFRDDKISVINDSKGFELITSSASDSQATQTIELSFKKTITIQPEDVEDREALDRIICEIRDFCDQSAKINNYEYSPITIRGIKNAVNRTGSSSG